MDFSDRLKDILDRVLNSEDNEDVQAAYQEWAKNYDNDLAEFGYLAPINGAKLFTSLVEDKNALIYDAGCGTGLTGKALVAHGYTQIHGADFSDDMLAQARKLDIYQKLLQANFQKHLPMQDQTFDAIISTGVYTSTIGSMYLDELIRVVKKGGTIVLTCRSRSWDDDLLPQIQAHESAGTITVHSMELQSSLPEYAEGVPIWYVALVRN